MIQLGAFDDGVAPAARDAYLKELETITRVPLADIAASSDRIAFTAHSPGPREPMTVKAIQKALKDLGFFPGGKEDGICGYRTLSAIRLFQEYVRSVEKLPCVPDGRFGPESQAHLQRWLDQGLQMAWAPTIEQWRARALGDTEYTRWLALLDQVKAHYLGAPGRMLQLVNAFGGKTSTRKVADWDFSPAHVHLVGIRRSEANLKFDDILVLLIKGLVFKFQGSTDPGSVEDGAPGAPFLVQGQHDYHFGWHQKTYLALRPLDLGSGVLVVRSKSDLVLDEADLNGGVKPESTINVHWGGMGGQREVGTWSKGCQVINGTAYLTPSNDLVSCATFVGLNNTDIKNNPSKTRGAYNVLLDLVTALGSDIPTQTVKYTLLTAADLEFSPELKKGLADARTRAGTLLPA